MKMNFAGLPQICRDGSGDSSGDRATSASLRMEEPPPLPPETLSTPPKTGWREAEAHDALLTPEDTIETEEDELTETQQIVVKMLDEDKKTQWNYDEALEIIGFGKYNVCMIITCSLLILGMCLDIFGFSVVLPIVACDMGLTTQQQGMLSAIPLIGVMISSYGWGLCADTVGRRATLLIAMPVGVLLNLAAGIAPTYSILVAIKFFSGIFSASANAAAFVLLGESTSPKHRSRAIFLVSSATVFVQLVVCLFALAVFKLKFDFEISWLSLHYVPWRMLIQVISIPGILGVTLVAFLHESPKFLLSKKKEEQCLDVLRTIYRVNKGSGEEFSVTSIFLDELLAPAQEEPNISLLKKILNQTIPLFKPPLLRNSAVIYYILLCAFMTTTGYTMWVPSITNAYFHGEDTTGLTFCEVASKAAVSANSTTADDCTSIVPPKTYYAVACYSGGCGLLLVMLSFLVGIIGNKRLSLAVVGCCAACGFALLFVRIPILSIILFYGFLYVGMVLGNMNTYLVEVNPTHLRGMATSLSVVVARGFGFVSVQIIARLLHDHCVPMVSGYVALLISGFIVAIFLPVDISKSKKEISSIPSQAMTNINVENIKTKL